jgi:O-antigen ligase
VLFFSKPRLAILLGLAGALFLLLFSSTVQGLMTGGDNSYSYLTRVEAWRILIDMVKISPVFGLGMANYYWYTPLYPILGWRVSFNSHNNYIDLTLQSGIVGLICFLWLFWELGVAAWKLHQRLPEGFDRAYTIGALGGWVATLVAAAFGDWVIPFVYNIGLGGFRASLFAFLFLGGVLAIQRWTDAAERAEAA